MSEKVSSAEVCARVLDEVMQTSPEQTPDELRQLLDRYHVPVSEWNAGAAKSFDHLVNEVREGESVLFSRLDETGSETLVRRTRVAAIDVFYQDPGSGRNLRLVEEKQVFKDGRTRTRPHVTTSLGEKLKADEDGTEAARRAVKEELGFEPAAVSYQSSGILQKDSNSFPGLHTELQLDYYRCEASDEDFRPEGYVERQTDKDVYFVWQELPPAGE